MTSLKTALVRAALDGMYYTAAHRLFPPRWHGVGVIFTLHHVRPGATSAFDPNGILEITPEFLDRVIELVLASGFEIITLDDAHERLVHGDFARPFTCFTLDDGYADNYHHALPVFLKHNVPFHVYVTAGMPQGELRLWWRELEHVIRAEDDVTLRLEGGELRLPAGTVRQKRRAFSIMARTLRELPHEHEQRALQQFFDDYPAADPTHGPGAAMSWEMINALADSGLAGIGAHTYHHYQLSKLPLPELLDEVDTGRRIIAEHTNREPSHFAYPYGDSASAATREFDAIRELGFRTATTTRKGVLFAEHRRHLHALPRVSLNGDYQRERYLRLFLSGAPFALSNGFRTLDVS